MAQKLNYKILKLKTKVKKNPYDIQSLAKLGTLYSHKGKYSLACQHYEQIVRIDSKSINAWTALGNAYLLKQDYQKCLMAYQKLVKLQKGEPNAQVWYGLALLYQIFNSHQNAIDAMREISIQCADFILLPEVYYRLGSLFQMRQQYYEAIDAYNQSLNCSEHQIPSSRKIDTLLNLSLCYWESNQGHDCFQSLNQALQLNRQNFKTNQIYGWLAGLSGSYTQSLDLLRAAKQLVKFNVSEFSDTLYLMARVHEMSGSKEEAYRYYIKVLEANSLSHVYYNSLGILFAKCNQIQDAFEMLGRAYQLNKFSPEIHRNLSLLYYKNAQYDQALKAFNQYVQLDSSGDFKIAVDTDQLQGLSFQHSPVVLNDIPFSLIQDYQVRKRNVKPFKELIKQSAEKAAVQTQQAIVKQPIQTKNVKCQTNKGKLSLSFREGCLSIMPLKLEDDEQSHSEFQRYKQERQNQMIRMQGMHNFQPIGDQGQFNNYWYWFAQQQRMAQMYNSFPPMPPSFEHFMQAMSQMTAGEKKGSQRKNR